MPHVSRIKLSKNTEEELLKNLNLALSSINDSSEMISFLNSLLTPTERIMIAKRLATIILIEENLSDSDIADTLHLTRITVAKMRLFYEARGQGFKIALKKLKEHKRFEEFKEVLLSLAHDIAKASGGRVRHLIPD